MAGKRARHGEVGCPRDQEEEEEEIKVEIIPRTRDLVSVQFQRYVCTQYRHLIKSVAGKLEEALAGKHNRIVGQRRIRDHEVLLRSLQRLHQRVVRVVQHLGRGKRKTHISTGIHINTNKNVDNSRQHQH